MMEKLTNHLNELNKQRVLDFEKSLIEVISSISDKQKDILEVSNCRRKYCSELHQCQLIDTELAKQRLRIFSKNVEAAKFELKVADVKLKLYFDAQYVQQILTETKETNLRNIAGYLSEHEREAIQNDQIMIKEAIEKKINLMGKFQDLMNDLETLKLERSQGYMMNISKTKDKNRALESVLEDTLSKSKCILQKVTGEYLVLRHNNRAAQAIFKQKEVELIEEKDKSHNICQQLLREYEEKVIDTERLFESQTEVSLNYFRNKIMNYEEEVKGIQSSKTTKTTLKKSTRKALLQEIDSYNHKYDKLQLYRQQLIPTIFDEIQNLKSIVDTFEQKLLYKNQNNHIYPYPRDSSDGTTSQSLFSPSERNDDDYSDFVVQDDDQDFYQDNFMSTSSLDENLRGNLQTDIGTVLTSDNFVGRDDRDELIRIQGRLLKLRKHIHQADSGVADFHRDDSEGERET